MDDQRDDDPTSTSDLAEEFKRNPKPFVTSESSRAEPRGQVWCICEKLGHIHGPGKCGWAVYKERLCRDCYELVHGSIDAGE